VRKSNQAAKKEKEMSDFVALMIFIAVPSLVAMTIGFYAMWRERH
jgi:flagellar basal body-associated protein FliL